MKYSECSVHKLFLWVSRCSWKTEVKPKQQQQIQSATMPPQQLQYNHHFVQCSNTNISLSHFQLIMGFAILKVQHGAVFVHGFNNHKAMLELGYGEEIPLTEIAYTSQLSPDNQKPTRKLFEKQWLSLVNQQVASTLADSTKLPKSWIETLERQNMKCK